MTSRTPNPSAQDTTSPTLIPLPGDDASLSALATGFSDGTARPTSFTDGRAAAVHGSERGSVLGVLRRLTRLGVGDSAEAHDQGRELRRAVRAQDVGRVRAMIAAGVGVNESQEASLACIAARRANMELLRLLVEAGVDINRPDRRSQTARARTALQEAARKGWMEGLVFLLGLGAPVDACEAGDATALHIAARLNHPDVVRLLLKAGANPAGDSHAPTTPLHDTTSLEVLVALLEGGARPDARDRNRATPLHLQVFAGHVAGVDALLKAGADPNAVDRKGRPPMFLLGGRGDVADMYAWWRAAAVERIAATAVSTAATLRMPVTARDRDALDNTVAHAFASRARDPEQIMELARDTAGSEAPFEASWIWTTPNAHGFTPTDILLQREKKDWVEALHALLGRRGIVVRKCAS